MPKEPVGNWQRTHRQRETDRGHAEPGEHFSGMVLNLIDVCSISAWRRREVWALSVVMGLRDHRRSGRRVALRRTPEKSCHFECEGGRKGADDSIAEIGLQAWLEPAPGLDRE